jgi:hypothetical protein
MARPDVRARMVASLRARGHRPPVQGGNGRGLTRPQALLLAALPPHWRAEVVIPLGVGRLPGFPTCYKVDLADEGARLAVEIDGASHQTLLGRGRDVLKAEVLAVLGWRLLRFRNAAVLADVAGIARAVLAAADASSARVAAPA